MGFLNARDPLKMVPKIKAEKLDVMGHVFRSSHENTQGLGRDTFARFAELALYELGEFFFGNLIQCHQRTHLIKGAGFVRNHVSKDPGFTASEKVAYILLMLDCSPQLPFQGFPV